MPVVLLAAVALQPDQPPDADGNATHELGGPDRVQPSVEEQGSGAVAFRGGAIDSEADRSPFGTQRCRGPEADRGKGREFVSGADRDPERRGTIVIPANVREPPGRSDAGLDLEAELVASPARRSDAEDTYPEAQAHARRTRRSAGRPPRIDPG